MKILFALLIGVIGFCAYLLLDTMRTNAKRRKSLQERLVGDGNLPEEQESVGLQGEMSSQAMGLLGFMRGIGINVDEGLRKQEVRFARAGLESPDAPVYYMFFQRVASFGFAVVGGLIIASAKGSMTIQGLGGLIILAAFFGPNLFIQNMIDKRTKLLQRAFPDTLDLLMVCVESGLALDAGLARVCNELSRAYPEITKELNRTRLELSLLNDRVKALMNLGDRTGMVAFRSLVVALVQSERFGTSLTDTLRVLSEDFRLQRLATAEAKAARLPVLMTLPLMVLLMPAFFIIILGPAVIKMMAAKVNH